MPDSPTEVFRTHFHYLRAFATMCGHIHGRRLPHNMQVRASEIRASLVRFATAGPPDQELLKRSLHNAWGTELLLASSYEWLDDDDLIRINNCWAVIQAYYVHYHAVQALVVALGGSRPATHPATQTAFAQTWAGRRADMRPCTLGFGPRGAVNVPEGIQVDASIHPWSTVDNHTCWSLAAKALRTTRQEAIRERKSARREEKRRAVQRAWRTEEAERLSRGRRARREPRFGLPQLTAAERQHAERSVRVHTVMDYLYRLRVKANYLDSTVFTEGPDDEEVSRRVLQELKDISANTLLVHELHIRSVVGEVIDSIADEWLENRANPPNVGLLLRREHWST